MDNIRINNNKLLEFIEKYNDFNDLSIIEYLSNSFIIHKERIKIEKISLLLSNNDLINNDLINNDLSNNDLINNDLINNDLSNNDLSNNDLSNNDLINNDLINNDLSNNDLSNNDLSNNDLSNNDLSNNDLSNNDLSNNDLSNNIININSDEFIIFINNSDENIIIKELDIDNILDTSYNNHEYICYSNNNLIINKSYDTKILYKKNIDYLIFKDLCKNNKIIDNPQQLFENYDTINEEKNNIFILNDKNILNDDDCNYFIKLLNIGIDNKEYNIEKWGNGSNVNCLFMNVADIKNIELKKKVDNKIFQIINKIINYLYKTYNILSTGDSGYCLRKIYGCTREHKDGVLSSTNNENKSIYKNQIRNMSIIIALNDDYENGEFYFPKQNFKIKLKKGEIIVFPPYWTHPHFVTEPTNNTYRYTINTWLYE